MTDRDVDLNSEAGTSTSLLRRSILNQPDAWDRLVQLYGPLVYEWCRKWGLQPCDAENIGQEVFLKVAQHLAGFRRDRPNDTFRGWLYRIARNTFLDQARQQRCDEHGRGGDESQRQFFELAVPAQDDEDERALDHETGRLYRRALELIRGEFSQRDWDACFSLLNGRPAREVAASLGVTPNVVYLAKSRIMRRVREEFADLLPEAAMSGQSEA